MIFALIAFGFVVLGIMAVGRLAFSSYLGFALVVAGVLVFWYPTLGIPALIGVIIYGALQNGLPLRGAFLILTSIVVAIGGAAILMRNP